MDELLAAVRKACSPNAWSMGVELARRLEVTGVSSDEDEIVCRVKVHERLVPYTVTLYPEGEEWDCSCQTRAKCCEHVAAAVIAVKKARSSGEELPQGRSSHAKLIYRFSRLRGELCLKRVLVKSDGTEMELETTLASAVARQTEGVELRPSQEDLNVDRVLQPGTAMVPRELAGSVLRTLAAARNLELDGKPVSVSPEILRPSCVVTHERTPAGDYVFDVHLRADARVTEVVASGVALASDTLHELAETSVTGPKLEHLPNSKRYAGPEVLTLVTEVLPGLKRRFEVKLETDQLPELVSGIQPRIRLQVDQFGDNLTVLGTLVYGEPALARIDGGRLVHLRGPIPLRNESAEQRVVAESRQRLGLTPGAPLKVQGERALELAMRLARWEGEIAGPRGGQLIYTTELAPNLEASERSFSLRFDGNNEQGETLEASAESVIRAYQQGVSLVPLLGGGFAHLPAGFMALHGERIAQLLTAREQRHDGQLPKHALPELAALCEALDAPAPPELTRLRALANDFEHIPQATLPNDLCAELRPYQRTGVNWLTFLKEAGLGATLADDMGLGKTLQTLCVLSGRCLVVCPTSVVFNWADELRKFRPGLSYAVYHGPKRRLDPDAHVTLTSYALLRLDQAALSAVDWDVVVIDEAQTIKNPESQVTQAAYSLKANFRMTLSGTPVENRLEELWSQFHFTNPGLLGGRSDFQAQHADPVSSGVTGAAERLRRKIRPFLLRRNKRTVAPELPPRSDIVLRCDLSESERQLYDAIFAATKKDVVEQLRAGDSVMLALEALLRLRQAACHPALVPGSDAASSSKTERLVDALEAAQADGHKSLVFSQWTSFLDLLEPHLQARGLRYNRLDGSTKDRGQVVADFQSPAGPEVMLLSLKAGGTGLNLTAADHVFLMDLWWNPAVEQQAMDRAHRIGQENPVFVYRLVAKDTVEERILALQDKKRAIADAALEGGAAAQSLTREDLLALLD